MTEQIYGLIGHPVAHSLSPAMQAAAFEALGIDARYELFDVEPDDLERFLKGMPRSSIAGVNVTIPYKIKAKDYLDRYGRLDAFAGRLGAVNTIKVCEDGTLWGFNTDGPGFYRSLVDDLRFEPEGKTIFVLGAGGAARAVVMYLGNGPSAIYASDIDQTRLAALKDHYAKYYDAKRLAIVKVGQMKEALDKSDLLINATPVGMKEGDPSPIDKSLLHTGIYVYDLVYNRPLTELLKNANSLKCHAVTGAGMLLYQGAIAFQIWTGRSAPIAAMRKALKEAIKKTDD